jgi:hypothetical protein
MDINTFLNERARFNNFLFSMSFPDIVNYLEKNPRDMSKVEWDLFTNSSIRTSKNIDNYPEIILKHSNWPWKFKINLIQEELNRKISKLSKLSKPNIVKVSNQNVSDSWIDRIINSMEKMCEIQNKLKSEESEKIIKFLQKEEKKEEKKQVENFLYNKIISSIENEKMPPENVDNLNMNEVNNENDNESDNQSEDFEEEDPTDVDNENIVDFL